MASRRNIPADHPSIAERVEALLLEIQKRYTYGTAGGDNALRRLLAKALRDAERRGRDSGAK